MRLNGCWFGWEIDFNLELPSVSFSFGPFVDEDPELVEVERPRFGDVVSNAIGFAQTPHPGWERPLNHWDEPSEGDEDV